MRDACNVHMSLRYERKLGIYSLGVPSSPSYQVLLSEVLSKILTQGWGTSGAWPYKARKIIRSGLPRH